MKKISLCLIVCWAVQYFSCNRNPGAPPVGKIKPLYAIEFMDAGKNWFIKKLFINEVEQQLTACQQLARIVFRKTIDEVRRGSMNYPDSCGTTDNFLWDVNNTGKGFVIANTAFQNDCEVLSLTEDKLVIKLSADGINYKIEFESR